MSYICILPPAELALHYLQLAFSYSWKLKTARELLSVEVWCVRLSLAFPQSKPCYDGATAATEKALGAGSRLWTLPHLLSDQHTQTGTETHTEISRLQKKHARGKKDLVTFFFSFLCKNKKTHYMPILSRKLNIHALVGSCISKLLPCPNNYSSE